MRPLYHTLDARQQAPYTTLRRLRLSSAERPRPEGLTTFMSVAVVAQDITHRFPDANQGVTALRGVSLSLKAGEFVAVIGPSGGGKTTLLRILGGLLAPTQGQVFIGGQRPQAAQACKSIGYVSQQPGLLPWRTALENVRLPLEVNHRERGNGSPQPEELLVLVGLADRAQAYPSQLSGGMQQRLALARALVLAPSLLLMDEPFGALDEMTRRSLWGEMVRLWELRRPTVLFVTHSVAEAAFLADRVLVLVQGRIKAELPITLPRPRQEAMEETPLFLDHEATLRRLLRQEVMA